MDDFVYYGEKPLTREAEWQPLFSPAVLEQAKDARIIRNVKTVSFNEYRRDVQVTAMEAGSRASSLRQRVFHVLIDDFPSRWGSRWTSMCFRCDCGTRRYYSGTLCAHIAAAMLAWDAERGGPFLITESESARQARLREENRHHEMDRQEQQMKDALRNPKPVLSVLNLPENRGVLLYDMRQALSSWQTTDYAVSHATEINDRMIRAEERELRDGTRILVAVSNFYSPLYQETLSASCVLYARSLEQPQCSCAFHSLAPVSGHLLCAHQLALLQYMANYLGAHSVRDMTDDAARTFFRELHQSREELERADAGKVTGKRACLELLPRIVVENGEALLSFKIGRQGGKMLILRSLAEMIRALQREEVLELSKKETVNFAEETFTEASQPWLTYVQRRVEDVQQVNSVLENRRSSWSRPTSISLQHQQSLTGAALDQFYDTAQGQLCEFNDKDNQIKSQMIPVEHRQIQFALTVDNIPDAAGDFAGVMVSGFVPVMLSGGSARYVLNKTCLSRLDAREEQVLSPFLSVSDATGLFRFRVGREHLQEFYYRALPSLLENPFVRIVDHTDGQPRGFLPPEPQFGFYLDLENETLLCRCRVAYEEKEYTLSRGASRSGEYRDTEQENRVREVLAQVFPDYESASRTWRAPADDEALYDFLTEGISRLEKYGVVHGTGSFRRPGVRPVSGVQVGVAVQSGLMDISVLSRDYSPEELLALLDSYQKKKRYYRLRSGDYVDLTDSTELSDMLAFFGSMDLIPTDAIKQKLHLPLYRALYLDRMLEEHENLASSRDRTYRALIKNFKTIRDADWEVPAPLEEVLRPYQVYGYKWLRTLEEAGFGGILADEMGLGKTVQMIAVFLNARNSGVQKPSLVICPASLVYNWQEEIRRFAPDLPVRVIAGTAGARRELLREIAASADAEVCITSYDLLKRDIGLYEGLRFHSCVLDEAQYIKNQKAAVTKSVKLIACDHRYALTGTPIENRLSELWSIFDFLMPGFLYKSDEFIRRFETPITRDKDEETTAQLKKMVSPFLLRRLKQDVLKDLPPKLEEIRYARFDSEQQKLYDAQVVRMKQMISDGSGSGEDKIKILAELTRIRQICCDPSLLFENYHGESAKRAACLELVRSAIDGGHRMLIFSQFTSMLALLEQDLKENDIAYYQITGATPKEVRVSLVSQFNEGDVPVFLVSLKAGGTGLNLTGADMVIHYDPWWNLAAQNQATDRAHRIGQTRQVTVYRMIVKDTIEEKIVALQDAKKDLADAILEGRGESLMSLSNEELLALLS